MKDNVLVFIDAGFVPIIKDIQKRGIAVVRFSYFDRKRGSPFSLSNHLINSCFEYTKLTKEDFAEAKNGK